MSDKKTAILMATYNGEKYIREQLDSLYFQTRRDWTLYVHDDGSTDGTMAVLREYARAHSGLVLLDYPSQGGAKNNFFSMLRAVDADYYFFCDQDDKWMPDKVEAEMEAMSTAESLHGNIPITVYTDAHVVSRDLNIISRSMWEYTNTHPEMISSFDDCVRTVATGCTMCFNRKAKQALVPPSDIVTMHDCWLFLCVMRAGGVCVPLFRPTMLYRQHTDNALGARAWKETSLIKKLAGLRDGLRKEWEYYRMLRELGYGSYFKFRHNLMKYRKTLRKKQSK